MDYYHILGIREDSSKEDIKKAYRKLALKYHPDKNTEVKNHSSEKFNKAHEAYKTLIDDRKRESYDRFDLPLLKQQQQQSSSNSGSSRSHHRTSQHHSHHRRDDNFFRGKSDKISEEQKYQDELERIRTINSDLLDEANAEIKRQNKRRASQHDQKRKKPSYAGKVFVGDILSEVPDEEYEKIVLDKFKKVAAANG